MCLNPHSIEDAEGNQVEVACRSCWQCRSNRVNDLIGRCIAEQSVSAKALAVTLTYSGDTPQSAVLRYSDVQKFLKYLRAGDWKQNNGYDVRYICAGEYGSRKGRAHWHIILFFQGKVPDLAFDRRIEWKYWPHGFVYAQNPDYGGFKYVLKYALKDTHIGGSVKTLSMSKRPPLGHSFFMDLADTIAEKGLAMWSPDYYFSDVVDSKGAIRRFWLQGRMREMFLERYCDTWQRLYNKLPPYTDFLYENYLDPIARKQLDLDPLRLEKRKALKQKEWVQALIVAERLQRENERQSLGYCLVKHGGADILIAYSDFTAELTIGDHKWHLSEGSVGLGEQLSRTPLNQSRQKAALRWLEQMFRNHRSS